jgi:hypothetical protein
MRQSQERVLGLGRKVRLNEAPADDLDTVATPIIEARGATNEGLQLLQLLGTARLVHDRAVRLGALGAIDLNRDREAAKGTTAVGLVPHHA